MAATGERVDPFRSYNFLVEIDGITQAGFKECRGLDAFQDIVEYREGKDRSLSLRKLPGLSRHPNIILMRGITIDLALWKWREEVINGKINRKTCTISLCDDTGPAGTKMSWNFSEAWPVKWVGPYFDATSSEVAIEALEITHEGMTILPAAAAEG